MSDIADEAVNEVSKFYAGIYKARKEGKTLDDSPYLLLSDSDWQRERWLHVAMIEPAFVTGVMGAKKWVAGGDPFPKGIENVVAKVSAGVKRDLCCASRDNVVHVSLRRVFSLLHKWTEASSCPEVAEWTTGSSPIDIELAFYNAIMEIADKLDLQEGYAKDFVSTARSRQD